MSMRKALLNDKFLIAAIIISILYMSCCFLLYNYSFQGFERIFFDIGIETYNMYWHLHGALYTNPFQFIVFANHISPFFVLILPLFALDQNAMTLVFIQDMFLAATSVVAYLTGRQLIKNDRIAFYFFILFLFSPGISALAVYDFHAEAFVPMFVILSFYFYTKGKIKYFVMSYLLLLMTIEVAYFLGAALLLGLLAYEIQYKKYGVEPDALRVRRRHILYAGFIMTIATAIAYYAISGQISASYAGVSYYKLTPYLRLANYVSGQINAIANPSIVNTTISQTYPAGLAGVTILVLQFGGASLFSPISTLLLLSPWLGEVFIVHNLSFTGILYQYYGFFAGNCFVAAILGYIVVYRRPDHRSRYPSLKERILAKLPSTIMIIGITTFLYTDLIIFGYLLSGEPAANSASLSLAIAAIPQNAVVMTQSTLSTHMANFYQLEMPPTESLRWFEPRNASNTDLFWAQPQYILIDKNTYDYTQAFNTTQFNVYSYMRSNYTEIYNSSGVYLYEIKR